MALDNQTIQTYLYEQIPITQGMKIQVIEVRNESVSI